MTEQEIKQLHHRASQGEKLTAVELSVLQDWYDENDRIEESSINWNQNTNYSPNTQQQLNQILAQVSQSANKAEQLARQNELLKLENEKLRRAVENRLLEKVV